MSDENIEPYSEIQDDVKFIINKYITASLAIMDVKQEMIKFSEKHPRSSCLLNKLEGKIDLALLALEDEYSNWAERITYKLYDSLTK